MPYSEKNIVRKVKDDNGNIGFVNNKGEEVIPFGKYDVWSWGDAYIIRSDYLTDYFFLISSKMEVLKYDYMDAMRYMQLDNFGKPLTRSIRANSLIRVNKDGREFYINKKGECVKDCN